MLGDAPPDPFDPNLLQLAVDLRRRGIEPARRQPPGQPEYVRVRRGVWIEAGHWERMLPVTRHAAFVHATALCCDADSDNIYSHESAAALWGMPRIEPWPQVAHVTTLRPVRSSARLRTHECELDAYLVRSGVRVTTPERTVVDLARTGSLFKVKYRVPEGASAEEAGRVLWREKQRDPPTAAQHVVRSRSPARLTRGLLSLDA